MLIPPRDARLPRLCVVRNEVDAAAGPHGPDEATIGTMMYMKRIVATSRILRCHVPPHQLDPDELIELWADERTAGTDAGDTR